MNALTTFAASCGITFACLGSTLTTQAPAPKTEEPQPLQLGAFSVSLAVKDIKASKAFYEKLDFKEVGGELEKNWVILRNGTTTIGLFQGMFEKNIMTFNPGWDAEAKELKEFQDVRELQRTLKARGLSLVMEADAKTKGPASFVLLDPDGNMIMADQHVASPKD